jgi:hypothetical protein
MISRFLVNQQMRFHKSSFMIFINQIPKQNTFEHPWIVWFQSPRLTFKFVKSRSSQILKWIIPLFLHSWIRFWQFQWFDSRIVSNHWWSEQWWKGRKQKWSLQSFENLYRFMLIHMNMETLQSWNQTSNNNIYLNKSFLIHDSLLWRITTINFQIFWRIVDSQIIERMKRRMGV